MINQYEYKFYLNINHAIFIKNKLGQIHPHTWELTMNVLNISNDFIQFDKIEKLMNDVFEKYQDQIINETPPFDKINPTLENVVKHFKDETQDILIPQKLILLSIEISETPSRSFILNLFDDIDINLLNINKLKNDEDSLIAQIILQNDAQAQNELISIKESLASHNEGISQFLPSKESPDTILISSEHDEIDIAPLLKEEIEEIELIPINEEQNNEDFKYTKEELEAIPEEEYESFRREGEILNQNKENRPNISQAQIPVAIVRKKNLFHKTKEFSRKIFKKTQNKKAP